MNAPLRDEHPSDESNRDESNRDKSGRDESNRDWPKRVAILGVGLLGGSVALSIRRRRGETVFVGYSRTLSKLDLAVESGLIDVATDSIESACRDCDVVVIAAPVDRIAALAIEAAASTGPACLITDVGSTKAGIVATVQTDPAARTRFVAAHPIAGSEKSGYQHARADLFDGKVVVITPGESVEPAMKGAADQFWSLTGAKLVAMGPADHDRRLAAVSHVPHLVSSLVAGLLPEAAASLVGSGWRDITRVAAGDPEMWLAICQENRSAIESELGRLAGELDHLMELIRSPDGEGLRRWLAAAKACKESTQSD